MGLDKEAVGGGSYSSGKECGEGGGGTGEVEVRNFTSHTCLSVLLFPAAHHHLCGLSLSLMEPQGPPILEQHQCRSFWRGYGFVSDAEELAYQERYRIPDARMVQMWVLLTLLADLALFALFAGTHTSLGRPYEVYLMYIPNVSLCLVTLGVVSRVPVKYLHPFLSAVAVLVTWGRGLIVNAHVSAMPAMAKHSLATVYSEISDNPVALQELQEYVRGATVEPVTAGLCYCGMTMAMLLLIGVHRSTIVAAACIPLAYGWVAFGPHVLLADAIFRVGILMVACLLLLVAMRSVILMRRRQFRLERSFQAALQEALEASRKADSILNHTLKNTMADAAADIEMFLTNTDLPEPSVRHLRLSMATLRRGMRACRHRQAYIKLESAGYQPSLQPVQLSALVDEVTAGRDIRVSVEDKRVLLDEKLYSLVLDNTINNAFKHGRPQDPQVQLTVSTAPVDGGASPADDKHVRVTFRLSNQANPSRPRITDDYVAKVLRGESKENVGALSDQIGLQHSLLACQALNVTASLTQSGQTVVFTAVAVVKLATQMPSPDGQERGTALDQEVAAFPPDLKICCIDDSDGARRLLDFNLRARAKTGNVHVFGKERLEVSQFMEAVLDGGDIAILDQHLEFEGEGLVYGTDLVRELRRKRFQGLLCARSANVAPEDRAKYIEAGVHCIFGKDLGMRDMIAEMQITYVRTIMRPLQPGCLQAFSTDNLVPVRHGSCLASLPSPSSSNACDLHFGGPRHCELGPCTDGEGAILQPPPGALYAVPNPRPAYE